MALYYPARWFLNALRGIDSFVFALLFVAAVGLGPFAGVLGIALHTWGSTAKLWAEAIENIPPGPLEAAAATGASRVKVIAYRAGSRTWRRAWCRSALFWWEFNVRASTVLGVVGAGGIGQELKNSMDLLLFPRLLTIIAHHPGDGHRHRPRERMAATEASNSSSPRRAAGLVARVEGLSQALSRPAITALDERVVRRASRRVRGGARAERRRQDDALPVPHRPHTPRPRQRSPIARARHLGSLGGETPAARRELALIFQQFNLIRRLSALENVLAGRLAHVPAWRVLTATHSRAPTASWRSAASTRSASSTAPGRARTSCRAASSSASRSPARSRSDAKVILADEPVASLDPESSATVLEIAARRAVVDGRGGRREPPPGAPRDARMPTASWRCATAGSSRTRRPRDFDTRTIEQIYERSGGRSDP